MTSQVTNPGRSENLARHTSLAEAIAANLTAGRQEAEQASAPEQASRPAPEPHAPREPVEAVELEAREPVADGEIPEPEEQASDAEPERYTLADFADAAELEPDKLLDLLDVEVMREGERRQAPLKEVLEGYRWNAANTQKAQELAERRREIDAKLAEVRQAHDKADAVVRAQWADVDTDEQALNAQYHAMPWEQLRAQGQGAYADAEAQFARRRNELEARRSKLEQSYAQVMQQRQELAKRQQSEELPRQREEMLSRIPEWRDDSRMREESEAMANFVQDTFGIEREHIAEVTDARIVAMLHRLWKLERQATAVPVASKKAKAAPRTMKPGRAAAKQSSAQQRRDKLKSRLRRTGHRNDLAALVLDNIRGEK